MKKKIIIAVVVIVGIIIATIGYFVIKDLSQENILRMEAVELNGKDEMSDDYMKIKIKTTGDYALVETAIKNYMKDYSINFQKSMEVINEDKFSQILSVENYEQDGPNFVETKELIKKGKESFEKYSAELLNMTEEEKIMSYLDQSLESYYQDLYKELLLVTLGFDNYHELRQDCLDGIEIINTTMKGIENIIDYLIQEKGNWKIDDGMILFQTDEQLEGYNALVDQLDV